MATYAVADLHGNLNLYKQIKAFLKPEDRVYFLGDAGDRGPEPWETIKAIAKDPQFIYLKGNHEDMLAGAIEEVMVHDCYDIYVTSLIQNGGLQTLQEATQEAQPLEWRNFLNKLSTSATYTNEQGITIILCHAGCTPRVNDYGKVSFRNDIWDREHFKDKWPEGVDNVVVVHGHTNLYYIQHKLGVPSDEISPDALWYCSNHKICIDTACYETGYTVLLDLDTFDEHYFEESAT